MLLDNYNKKHGLLIVGKKIIFMRFFSVSKATFVHSSRPHHLLWCWWGRPAGGSSSAC